MRWKYFLVLLLAFSLSLPVYSESETELKIREWEPEAVYEIQGKDLITLYTTIKELNETKTQWKNLTNETLKTSKDAMTLLEEYEKENKKLTFQNNLLIGGITVSVEVAVVGAIVWACAK